MLTVLSVAYPLSPVGDAASAGAEQVLGTLEAGLVRTGVRSLVVACRGSKVAGKLVDVGPAGDTFDQPAIDAARARHRAAIVGALQSYPVDVVHMHGMDFDSYLPPAKVPILITLHCPPDWYSSSVLRTAQSSIYFNAVSSFQYAQLPPNPHLLGPIENGVPVETLAGAHAKRGFALMLSRIAPEKGVHVALRAAHRARMPLIVAGALFPFPEHERYYAKKVAPCLDSMRRAIGPVDFARKRRLLNAACCLIVAPQVAETSSLAAREALAAGTPVIALRRGALADTVEHGRTGFLVDSEEELAQAMRSANSIDPAACRRVARARFGAETMTRQYLQIYQDLVARHPRVASWAGAA
jgi:glycosyltransferase involved in cell wall biosynthesis